VKLGAKLVGSSSDRGLKTKLLAELVGTYAISLLGPSAIVVGLLIPGLSDLQRLVFAGLVPGITLASSIIVFGKVSGSHVNPAITVTFASAGSFRRGLITPYILIQLTGALLAGLTLKLAFDSAAPAVHLGSNMLAAGVTPLQGIVLEVIDTAALCLVVHHAIVFSSDVVKQGAAAGVALSALILVFGPVSGGSMNPFRSLGPALFSGYLDGLYVYLIGPTIGAALAGFVFRLERLQSASGQSS